MVCQRCIRAVGNILVETGISYTQIQLGKVFMKGQPSEEKRHILAEKLQHEGFELLTDRNSQLIEKIKTLVIELVHYDREIPSINYSEYLARQLHHDYNYLSRLFPSVEGITIEKYIIQQKTERVKELLMYEQLTPTEIAYKMNYSSLQHMSNQFKKVTGLSPRAFQRLKEQSRKPLDDI